MRLHPATESITVRASYGQEWWNCNPTGGWVAAGHGGACRGRFIASRTRSRAMAISQNQLAHIEPRTSYRAYLFPLVAGLVVLLFLAAPWSLEHKAHAALHGLCAQRPSHSFTFGSSTLPFDARMTGIYGGFLGASVY